MVVETPLAPECTACATDVLTLVSWESARPVTEDPHSTAAFIPVLTILTATLRRLRPPLPASLALMTGARLLAVSPRSLRTLAPFLLPLL